MKLNKLASYDSILRKLIELYTNGDLHDRALIAKICDEVLDQSGELLGLVRDGSQQMKSETILDTIRQQTFHMNDSQARVIIDQFLLTHPTLLNIHNRDWYYKNC